VHGLAAVVDVVAPAAAAVVGGAAVTAGLFELLREQAPAMTQMTSAAANFPDRLTGPPVVETPDVASP